MTKSGPVKIQYLSCAECERSKRHLIQDGTNPIYEYFCGHPNWMGVAIHGVKTGTLGRVAGFDERTPEWCPELD